MTMAKGLRDRGMEVEVLTALPNYPTGRVFPGYRFKIFKKEFLDDIPVRRYWIYPSVSSKAIPRIISMLSLSVSLMFAAPRLLLRRPDILIINTPPPLVGLSGVLLAKISGAATVLNVSDVWPRAALDLGVIGHGRSYSTLERLERFMYEQAEAVLIQTEETTSHILSIAPCTSTFLYRNLDRVSDYLQFFPSLGEGPIRIVYAGLLGVAQGILNVCQNVNFAALGLEFHIYGDGHERTAIRQFTESHPNRGVVLHNPIPKSEVQRMLKDYHAMLVVLRKSIFGSFPSKLYGAVAAGLPIVYSGDGDGEKFVSAYRLGWVSEPADYDKLVQNLGELACISDDKYRTLRARIAELAEGTFDLDAQLDELVRFLKNLC